MLLHVPDQRILKGAPASLRAELLDADGEADTSIDSGVTVTVTRLDGTEIATAAAATSTADGVATYDLTASQTGAGLDVLTATWTHNSVVRATTVHEVVGRHWFAPSRLKAEKGVTQALAASTIDEQTLLVAARTWIETLIEWSTGVSWTPRTTLEAHDARNGDSEVILDQWFPRTLRSLTIDDVAEDVTDWSITRYGMLRRIEGGIVSAVNPLGVEVRYDYGLDAPPAPLLDAALRAAADRITSEASVLGRRLTGVSGEAGTISYAPIDRDHPTGILAVDAVILDHRLREPAHA